MDLSMPVTVLSTTVCGGNDSQRIGKNHRRSIDYFVSFTIRLIETVNYGSRNYHCHKSDIMLYSTFVKSFIY